MEENTNEVKKPKRKWVEMTMNKMHRTIWMYGMSLSIVSMSNPDFNKPQNIWAVIALTLSVILLVIMLSFTADVLAGFSGFIDKYDHDDC